MRGILMLLMIAQVLLIVAWIYLMIEGRILIGLVNVVLNTVFFVINIDTWNKT